jgi:hypothetical protein
VVVVEGLAVGLLTEVLLNPAAGDQLYDKVPVPPDPAADNPIDEELQILTFPPAFTVGSALIVTGALWVVVPQAFVALAVTE